MGSLYGIGYSGWTGVSGVSGINGAAGTVIRSLSNFRLTLESGVAVSSSNQEAKTTLYMTPYTGKQISLYYDEEVTGFWATYETSEISLSLSGYTANKNYDIWAYYTGSAVALDSTVWTNDSTRATAIVQQDGVWVKSGEPTKRYIGTIRTTGTTGQCEDSYTSRYVWNMYNRYKRGGFTTNTTASWTYSTGAWRESNAGTGQIRFKWVLGMSQSIFAQMSGNSVGTGYNGYCIDATTGYSSIYVLSGSYVYYGPALSSGNILLLSAGYHYLTGIEYATGSLTVYGGGNSTSNSYGTSVVLEN